MLPNFQAWFLLKPVFSRAAAELSLSPASFICRSPRLDSAEKNRTAMPGTGTILVVEDDRAIRSLFTYVLRGQGYEVIACEDGTEGLAVARLHIHHIDAVITDSTMPGLDGRALIDAIRSLRAEIPILIVSGSLEEGMIRAGEHPKTVRLCKPISPMRLAFELRRLLCDTMESLPEDDF